MRLSHAGKDTVICLFGISAKYKTKRKRPEAFPHGLRILQKGKTEGSLIRGYFYGAIIAASWACRACACLSSVAVVQVRN